MSYLLRGIAAAGTVRVVAADTTAVVNEALDRHGASLTAGAALGRTLTAALLLSHVLLKDHRDRVTLRLEGGGPLGGVIADAGLDGTVRGYVRRPDTELPPRPDGKLDVGGAVGRDGEIEVIRSHAPYGDPYASSVRLTSGEIAEDVAGFLLGSEQIPSAVLLGVAFEPGSSARVAHAAGIVLQALPGVEDGALALLEANVRAFGQLTARLASGSLLASMEELTWGLELEMLTDEALPLAFRCRCSQAKALDVLAYFRRDERERMIREDGGAEVVCHWCGEARWIDADGIRALVRPEVRCPECDALWYREGVTTMVRDGERCACGRAVELPA
ncbi:MAG: Hsp33 family molecular chaperone HslO [Trueperaceae bacterium]|nr:MAG: Hsp33 family molecular chaperone HslO [Trueperaceae bacterium]